MTHSTKAICVSTLVVAALLAALPHGAAAAGDPLAGGQTDLHMKKGFLTKLHNVGVRVLQANLGRVVEHRLVQLAVSSGELDPTTGRGTIRQSGGFRLKRGTRSVAVVGIEVNTATALVGAKVAGAQMKLGHLQGRSTTRDGFGADVAVERLELSAGAARRLSDKLGLMGGRRLHPGRAIAGLFSQTQPRSVELLPFGQASVFDSGIETPDGMWDKFEAKGVLENGWTTIPPMSVKVSPGPMSVTHYLLLRPPVTGGRIALDGSGGTIHTGGGLQFAKLTQSLSPTMRLSEFSFELDRRLVQVHSRPCPSRPLPATPGRTEPSPSSFSRRS